MLENKINQRVGSRFSIDNRIFLAGDAVHTHSPKAGQGMNVSMQDSFNLGWKLAMVIKGFARRDILSTYEDERMKIAKELIEFDQSFSRLWSERRNGREGGNRVGESTRAEAFQEAFLKQKKFSSGTVVEYDANILVDDANRENPAHGIIVGQRLPSARIVNHSDVRVWELARRLQADGRFRIILFAGNVANEAQMQRVHTFCNQLGSFLQRSLPNTGNTVGSMLKILTIHSAERDEVDLSDFPELLHPFDEDLGWDYDSIFVDGASYYEPQGHAYRKYGVDNTKGCVVAVRPDHHIGWTGHLEELSFLEQYFEGFLSL